AGLRPFAQAEIVPFSVLKMKLAAVVVPGTRNVVVGFQTRPVGVAGVGLDGLFGSLCLQAVAGMVPPGSGILTRSGLGGLATGCGIPAPSYSVEHPVALSATQKGLAPGVNATPQAFCSTSSVCAAVLGRSEVKLVTT